MPAEAPLDKRSEMQSWDPAHAAGRVVVGGRHLVLGKKYWERDRMQGVGMKAALRALVEGERAVLVWSCIACHAFQKLKKKNHRHRRMHGSVRGMPGQQRGMGWPRAVWYRRRHADRGGATAGWGSKVGGRRRGHSLVGLTRLVASAWLGWQGCQQGSFALVAAFSEQSMWGLSSKLCWPAQRGAAAQRAARGSVQRSAPPQGAAIRAVAPPQAAQLNQQLGGGGPLVWVDAHAA